MSYRKVCYLSCEEVLCFFDARDWWYLFSSWRSWVIASAESLQPLRLHQEIGVTLAWPDRFDNTKSGWCHIVYLYIDLAKVEIMAMDLPTYISGYHWDITRPSLVILMKTWSNFINAVQNLGIIYNYLYLAAFGCLNGDTS